MKVSVSFCLGKNDAIEIIAERIASGHKGRIGMSTVKSWATEVFHSHGTCWDDANDIGFEPSEKDYDRAHAVADRLFGYDRQKEEA